MNWDQYFLNLVYHVAAKSRDPSTKIGAIIVGPTKEILSSGYNGFPRGVEYNDPSREERPEKYFWYEHAERNAIYNAARHGIKISGSSLYTNGCPCADCARGVIQAGIREVIVDEEWGVSNPRWKESCQRSRAMFEEAGVSFWEVKANLERPMKWADGRELISI